MRASEFIRENYEAAGGQGDKISKTKIHKNASNAIKNLQTYPDLPSHYYDMYRFGVHMAGSPDNQTMETRSSVANQMATVAYTDADADIINNSAKAMNLGIEVLSSKQSKEPTETNKISPVAAPKRNKFGI